MKILTTKQGHTALFFFKGYHSQWHRSVFHDRLCLPFINCEQFMMYKKALLFGDVKTACAILETDSPKEQKDLGRTVANFDQRVWDQHKYNIVLAANLMKFSQSSSLRSKLFDTIENGVELFVEASPYDRIWGIGLGEDHPDIADEDMWQGQNLLGKAITQVAQLIKLGV